MDLLNGKDMKFGLIPVNIGMTSVEQMTGLAVLAESCGYESVWTFEHVIVPLDYASKYPYNAEGKMGVPPDANFIDPLIALAHMAAQTTTLKLGTGVNILPQTNPLYMAKQAASLDFVSQGRLLLGLGIGWLREEFEALGVPFERRGARFDDYLEAMQKVWAGGVVEHSSEFIQWQGFSSYPCAPELAVVIGGDKGKAFERVARFGQGWFAPTTDPQGLAEGMQKLSAACEAVGRDVAEIEISCMWPGQGGKEAVEALAASGADRLLVPTQVFGENPVEGIQALAQEVIA
jgi:probable F420-dependent oxidoreductase